MTWALKGISNVWVVDIFIKKSNYRRLWMEWTGFCVKRTYFLFGDTHKCNTFSDVDFEAFSNSAYIHLWYSRFQYMRVSKGGGFRLCNYLNLIWFLSELNTPHKLSLFFWVRIPRRPYVGPLCHDNFKVEKRVSSHFQSPIGILYSWKSSRKHRLKI